MKKKTKEQNVATTKPELKKVLILRTCNADMTSYGGFIWPESGPVKAPDWSAEAECGNGLHGWLWGSGDWSLAIGGSDKNWVVFEADAKDVVQLNGKVKVPSGDVLFVSRKWNEAMAFLRGRASLPCESSATGYSGHASATGNYGHASATGNSGHASATGDCGHASATGDCGWAVSNLGTAKAGVDGILTIRYKDHAGRMRVATAYVGESGIKANVFYSVNSEGKFVEATK